MSCKDDIFGSSSQILPAISWYLHMCSCRWNQWCLLPFSWWCTAPTSSFMHQQWNLEYLQTKLMSYCTKFTSNTRVLPNKYFNLGLNASFCVWVTHEHILFNFQQRENIIVKNYTVIHLCLFEWMIYVLSPHDLDVIYMEKPWQMPSVYITPNWYLSRLNAWHTTLQIACNLQVREP